MRELKIDLTKGIKQLEVITKGLVTTSLVGQYKSVFKGKGLEFADFREYAPDDDASMIDWKASARANKILIKEYMEERNIEIFFLVDTSSSMVFGSTEKLKNEYAAEIAASLSYVMLQAGDSVGFALFNDRIVEKFPPGHGKNQFYIISKSLVNPNFYGYGFDLEEALKFLIGYLRERTVVIIVSDFVGLKGEWQKYLKICSKKFDMISIMIRDPRDRTLPDEKRRVIIQDPYSSKQLVVVPSEIKHEYEAYVLQQEREIKEQFQKAGCEMIYLSTDKPFAPPIIDFFRKRQLRMI